MYKLDEKIDKLLKFAEEKFDLHTEATLDDLCTFGFDLCEFGFNYFNGEIKTSYYPEIIAYNKEISSHKCIITNRILYVPICKKNGDILTLNRMRPDFFLKYKKDSILFSVKKNSIKIVALQNIDVQAKIMFCDQENVINITKKQFDGCIDLIKELNNFRNGNLIVDRYKIQINKYSDMEMIMDELTIPKNISEIFNKENSIFMDLYYDENNTIGSILELECNEDLFETVRDQVDLLYKI